MLWRGCLFVKLAVAGIGRPHRLVSRVLAIRLGLKVVQRNLIYHSCVVPPWGIGGERSACDALNILEEVA